MVITKNQIRPRRVKVRFSNAEILAFDSTGIFNIIPPQPAGFALTIEAIQLRAQITVNYTNIDAAAFMYLFDDFASGSLLVNDMTSGNNLTTMFAPSKPLCLNNYPNPLMLVDSFGSTAVENGSPWTNDADIAANGGIFMYFDNNGSGDLTGGTSTNFFDVFIDYKIVNLNQ